MVSYQNYAPEYNIKINGESIPARLRAAITSVNYRTAWRAQIRFRFVGERNPLCVCWIIRFCKSINSIWPSAMRRTLYSMFSSARSQVWRPPSPVEGCQRSIWWSDVVLQRLTVGAKDRAFAIKIPKVGHFPVADPDVVTLVSFTNGLLPAVDPIGGALSFLSLRIFCAQSTRREKSDSIPAGGERFRFSVGDRKAKRLGYVYGQ